MEKNKTAVEHQKSAILEAQQEKQPQLSKLLKKELKKPFKQY